MFAVKLPKCPFTDILKHLTHEKRSSK